MKNAYLFRVKFFKKQTKLCRCAITRTLIKKAPKPEGNLLKHLQ